MRLRLWQVCNRPYLCSRYYFQNRASFLFPLVFLFEEAERATFLLLAFLRFTVFVFAFGFRLVLVRGFQRTLVFRLRFRGRLESLAAAFGQ